jgi:AraC family transcriptional regulator, transcriptional activator of pobA
MVVQYWRADWVDSRPFLDYLRLMTRPARLARYRGGIPVFRYVPEPESPPVRVLRFDDEPPHTQEFPALVYLERDDEPPVPETGPAPDRMRAGDLYLVAPGNVIRPPMSAFRRSAATVVFFTPEALGQQAGAATSWHAHPLLYPFVHGTPTGLLRLRVPAVERSDWVRTIDALERELAGRRDGYQQAALAHLTLLLVNVARLASDVLGDLRRSNERLLAEVFEVIERRYAEPLSLRDVAAALNLTPGHLTTAVRRKTGRTVQDWITERRLTEARRLLAETDLPVAEVGRRTGYPDAGYFARTFRRQHGVPPRTWRTPTKTPAQDP